MQVRDLAPDEAITLQCATCQSTVRWSRAVLVLAVGGGTDLQHIGLHDRLRCRGCGRAPSSGANPTDGTHRDSRKDWKRRPRSSVWRRRHLYIPARAHPLGRLAAHRVGDGEWPIGRTGAFSNRIKRLYRLEDKTAQQRYWLMYKLDF
jgi:hypothetical protein